MNDKYLQYYPWPKLEAEGRVFRSMLIDDNVFSSLPKLYIRSQKIPTVGEFSQPKYIDQICLEELKGDAIVPFVLFLNGETFCYSRPPQFVIPEYSVLWEVLLKVSTEPKSIPLVSPPSRLSEILDIGVSMIGSSYTKVDWLFGVIDSVYGGRE